MFRIGKEEIDAVARVIESKQLFKCNDGLKETENCEKDMRELFGIDHAVLMTSGYAALVSALVGMGIGPGDEVIIPAYTYIATAMSVVGAGAMPVIAEVDETLMIDPEDIEKKITERTKAIIPVHLYGQPCDMDAIMDIAKRHNLYVIEDCCQAIGAKYKGQMVGTFGDIGCFSFYPTKNLGGMGDGGLISVNSENLKNRIIALRNHGGAVRYYHDEIGVNSRLDEIQAAILRIKLNYIDDWNKARREHAKTYNELFAGHPDIKTPSELDNTYCVYHQYTLKIPNRDNIHKMLQEAGIEVVIGVHEKECRELNKRFVCLH